MSTQDLQIINNSLQDISEGLFFIFLSHTLIPIFVTVVIYCAYVRAMKHAEKIVNEMFDQFFKPIKVNTEANEKVPKGLLDEYDEL